MSYENVVVLVPGFFGFGRLGSFYYFADRVAACLRGAAQVAFGAPTPVLGVATVPTGSLAERQAFLLSKLTHADRTLRKPARYHLVGHSAGGLDAELLRAQAPLRHGTWSNLDPEGVRARISTITTISSPHYGTYLANGGVAGLLGNPLHHLAAIPEASAVALQIAKLAIERPVLHEAFYAGAQAWSDSARFLVSLLTDEELAKDLRTDSMEQTRHEHPPALRVPVTCFVTAIPKNPVFVESETHQREPRRPDELIVSLERLTAHVEGTLPGAADKNLQDLNSNPSPLIRNPVAEIPDFEPSTNDGVVNAMTQILRTEGARFGGLVMADHGDVIGHYDRTDPLTNGAPINDGVFRSGSGFGDDQFFALYSEVAKAFHARL
ncbi:MAG: hypothetical protein FWD17_19275 [Polyangiaceae bacterium]|nr:hypothetical protein [Polyangiaceae bacterium]